jgi:membrane protease YdiL (CAAX protease family)
VPVNVDPEYPGCPATVTAAAQSGVVLRPARWGIGDIVAMIAISLALAAVGGLALHAVDAPLSVVVVVGGLLGWVGLAGWPIIATIRRGNGPRIDLGLRLTWGDVRTGVVGGLIALAVAAVIAAVLMRFVGTFDSAAGAAAAELVEEGDRLAIILFSLMILVGAPIVEEIAFRGLAYGAVRKRGLGTGWAIVISAVLFSLMHVEPTRIPLLLGIGLVLGWVRARTGSTGAAMIAHAVVNAPGALFLMFGGVTP